MAKNIERWFEGIHIPIRSDQTVSSTLIACGADKPLKSHLETALKASVSIETTNVQLILDLGSFG